MSIVGEIIKYVQRSERLIVVSVVLLISGVVAHLGERTAVLDFADLPNWARPVCTLVWITAGVHVLVRLAMAAASGVLVLVPLAMDLPRRYRQQAADRPLVSNLLAIQGLAREVLCYARYRRDNHIWANDREHRWLNRLREAGLVELSDAGFGTAHYRIHDVAWRYMNRYPDRFIHMLAWRDPPWTAQCNEAEIERLLEARCEASASKHGSAGASWNLRTWRGFVELLRFGKA